MSSIGCGGNRGTASLGREPRGARRMAALLVPLGVMHGALAQAQPRAATARAAEPSALHEPTAQRPEASVVEQARARGVLGTPVVEQVRARGALGTPLAIQSPAAEPSPLCFWGWLVIATSVSLGALTLAYGLSIDCDADDEPCQRRAGAAIWGGTGVASAGSFIGFTLLFWPRGDAPKSLQVALTPAPDGPMPFVGPGRDNRHVASRLGAVSLWLPQVNVRLMGW